MAQSKAGLNCNGDSLTANESTGEDYNALWQAIHFHGQKDCRAMAPNLVLGFLRTYWSARVFLDTNVAGITNVVMIFFD